jgi:diguanylate cyclase (GGDEF)-like protein
VLLLPATEQARAREIAERLRADVSDLRPAIPGSGLVAVTISIGVAALAPEERSSLEDPGLTLVRRADGFLYEAKARGRNRVVGKEAPAGEDLTPPIASS